MASGGVLRLRMTDVDARQAQEVEIQGGRKSGVRGLMWRGTLRKRSRATAGFRRADVEAYLERREERLKK